MGINHTHFKIRTLRAVEKPSCLSRLKIRQFEVIVYLRTINSSTGEQEDDLLKTVYKIIQII